MRTEFQRLKRRQAYLLGMKTTPKKTSSTLKSEREEPDEAIVARKAAITPSKL